MLGSEFLEKAFSYIDSEEKWLQRYSSIERIHNGNISVSYCSLGAIGRAWDVVHHRNVDYLFRAVCMLTEEMDGNIPVFNDNHTYEEVRNAWISAIQKVKEREAEAVEDRPELVVV